MDAYEYTEKGAGWFFWSAKQQVVGLILLSLLLCFLHFWLSLWFLHLPLLLWLSFCCCCRGFCIIVTCKYSELSVVIFEVYWNHFRVKPTTGSGATWVCCSWVLLLLISAQGRPSASWRLAFCWHLSELDLSDTLWPSQHWTDGCWASEKITCNGQRTTNTLALMPW